MFPTILSPMPPPKSVAADSGKLPASEMGLRQIVFFMKMTGSVVICASSSLLGHIIQLYGQIRKIIPHVF